MGEAFRCGLFMTWPGKSDDKPVSPLFIFNATFPASEECAAGKPNYDRYKSFCSSAWDKGFENRGVTLESPSIDKKRAEQGERVVDDICGYMKKNLKTPFVGRAGEPSAQRTSSDCADSQELEHLFTYKCTPYYEYTLTKRCFHRYMKDNFH